MMKNIPELKVGIVAVSRDCSPVTLSEKRKKNVLAECRKAGIRIQDVPVMVENESHAVQALELVRERKINALVIYLGNFGPETPTTLLAQKFGGPVMFVAAAEESTASLATQRGDAYCGMLNASHNAALRKLRVHIPEYPVGTPAEIARMISEFIPVARTVAALSSLKIFSFGPRPQDFLACNAPIKPLYDLGIEIMENSELDLYDIYKSAEGDRRIGAVASSMARELGAGNKYPDMLRKLAQFEVALLNFMQKNLGASQFGIFANKCWPSFEKYFEFVPCYVNSRLAARGIPVSCEVDIYGALSEYIGACTTAMPATLLDIDPCSFGGIGVIAVKEMARFYRHILVGHRFPHHAAIAFKHAGKTIYDVFAMLGVQPSDVFHNQPAGSRYPTENPFQTR